MSQNSSSLNEEAIGRIILDSAFKIHTALGPGLLETIYESAMEIELKKHSLVVDRQKAIPVIYEGQLLDVAFRADLIVNGLVLVELKSVEAVTPLFKKTVTNYLKLIPLRLGYLINFNEVRLKDGIMRVVNGIDGKPFFSGTTQISKIDLQDSSFTSRSSRDN